MFLVLYSPPLELSLAPHLETRVRAKISNLTPKQHIEVQRKDRNREHLPQTFSPLDFFAL
jgi:hypothetical protein